jgi:hypothetical protein
VLDISAVWTFMSQPSAAVAFLSALAVAWPLGWWLARRQSCSRVTAVLFVLSAGVILALTLSPNEPGRYSLLPPHYLTHLGDPGQVWAALRALPDDGEEYANIALYVPLGFLGRQVWRSAARAALCGLALTVLVETCQFDIVGRAGSLTDIRNNTLGAVLGAGAAVALACRPRAATTTGRPPRER